MAVPKTKRREKNKIKTKKTRHDATERPPRSSRPSKGIDRRETGVPLDCGTTKGACNTRVRWQQYRPGIQVHAAHETVGGQRPKPSPKYIPPKIKINLPVVGDGRECRPKLSMLKSNQRTLRRIRVIPPPPSCLLAHNVCTTPVTARELTATPRRRQPP